MFTHYSNAFFDLYSRFLQFPKRYSFFIGPTLFALVAILSTTTVIAEESIDEQARLDAWKTIGSITSNNFKNSFDPTKEVSSRVVDAVTVITTDFLLKSVRQLGTGALKNTLVSIRKETLKNIVTSKFNSVFTADKAGNLDLSSFAKEKGIGLLIDIS